MQHITFIIFFFALGACVGSFLNVVVWRLPRGESLVSPRSHCPQCNTPLAWYDNIPILGWIALSGRCRYCKQPISIRYPIIEALTAALFVLYYVAPFIFQEGPCAPREMTIHQDAPSYVLYVITIAGLLASSLIDAEHFQIPIEIPWIIAVCAFVVHAFIAMPSAPGNLMTTAPVGTLTAGATLGLIISIVLVHKKLLPQSFAQGGPLLDWEKKQIEQETAQARAEGRELAEQPIIHFTRAQIRSEMQKEMVFLMPPMLLGGAWLLLTWKVAAIGNIWDALMAHWWLSGLLGSLWGAMVGAFLIWFFRIMGSIVFGREAMGLGDVHLMFGIGAVVGAAGAVFVFFLAPFFGLLFGLYKLIFRRGREVPYGPFLSMGTAVVLLFYCRLWNHFGPPLRELVSALQTNFLGD